MSRETQLTFEEMRSRVLSYYNYGMERLAVPESTFELLCEIGSALFLARDLELISDEECKEMRNKALEVHIKWMYERREPKSDEVPEESFIEISEDKLEQLDSDNISELAEQCDLESEDLLATVEEVKLIEPEAVHTFVKEQIKIAKWVVKRCCAEEHELNFLCGYFQCLNDIGAISVDQCSDITDELVHTFDHRKDGNSPA